MTVEEIELFGKIEPEYKKLFDKITKNLIEFQYITGCKEYNIIIEDKEELTFKIQSDLLDIPWQFQTMRRFKKKNENF